MSIILKGIDSPKMGECRRIVIYDNGDVVVNEERWGEDGYKHYKTFYDVEAIQIPKGHGRLIDADALETIFKDMAKCEWNQKVSPISWAYAFEDTIDEIDNAPTILEAEED